MQKPGYHPDSFYHWTEIRVRFRDLDPLNHVNNSVFNTYLEEARIRFVNGIPEFQQPVNKGNSFVLVHLEIDYVKPIHMTETVLVGSSIAEFGNSSIHGFQAIYSKESHELKAVAKTTGVWIDLKTGRPIRLPELKDREKFLYKSVSHG